MADTLLGVFSNTLIAFGPPDTFTLSPLAGGLINKTVRASCKHATFILKYAPPYFAARQTSISFGQERQIIEAAALSLFSPWLDGRLATISIEANVFVPRLLQHDVENYVLCMTDFGKSVSLTEFLSTNCPMRHDVGLEHAAEIGTRVGRFFGKLHSTSVSSLINSSVSGAQIIANCSGGRKLVREMVVEPLESTMLYYNVDANEASQLAIAVKQDWDASRLEQTFVLGDSWTGSVLLRLVENELKLAIIDWEFASFDSSGMCSDVATMLVHLKLRAIAAQSTANLAVFEACNILAMNMVDTYRETTIENGPAWTHSSSQWNGLEQLCRRFFIAVGRDMIHDASMSELDWGCNCCAVGALPSTCKLRASMVQEGVRWLRIGTSSAPEHLWMFVRKDDVMSCLFI